jgi:NAD dependent epimerase/dehydratase family enzyme
MKIAITGHTAGIGRSFAKYLAQRGHEIIGLSKRHGNNIRNIPKIVEKIIESDMWINNAQAGYAQTELLYKVVDAWKNNKSKIIWNISTIMTRDTGILRIGDQSDLVSMEYKNQKRALEDAHYELKNQGPRMCLICPGAVATQPYNQAGVDAADVNDWVEIVCGFYIESIKKDLWIEEISLGFKKNSPLL